MKWYLYQMKKIQLNQYIFLMWNIVTFVYKLIRNHLLVGWLCSTSHRQQGHLETTPTFTVPCKGREARFLHRSHRESNPRPSHGSPLHYRCATPAPSYRNHLYWIFGQIRWPVAYVGASYITENCNTFFKGASNFLIVNFAEI